MRDAGGRVFAPRPVWRRWSSLIPQSRRGKLAGRALSYRPGCENRTRLNFQTGSQLPKADRPIEPRIPDRTLKRPRKADRHGTFSGPAVAGWAPAAVPPKTGSGQPRRQVTASRAPKKSAARRWASSACWGNETVPTNEPEGRGRGARPFGSWRDDWRGPARPRWNQMGD